MQIVEQMRSTIWIIGGLLLLAIALHMWPSIQTQSIPGQYPLDAPRPAWRATPAVGRYRPRKSSDSLVATGFMDAKRSCGDGRVRGREVCTLPTVPVSEIYEPTILMQD